MKVTQSKLKPSVGVSTKNTQSLKKQVSWVHRGLYPILPIAIVALGLLTVSRILLSIWQWDQIPVGTFYIVMLQGLRVDIASICALFALPCLILCLFNLLSFLKLPKFIFTILKLYCTVGLSFLALNELATPGFILEFGVRPNHLYVQYLMFPKQIFGTLWGGHKPELFVCLFFTGLMLFVGFKFANWCFKDYQRVSCPKALLLLILTVFLVPLGIRSTFVGSPLSPDKLAFSNKALANSLPVNSSYNVIYAATHLQDVGLSDSVIYKVAPREDVIKAGQKMANNASSGGSNEKCPFNQLVEPFVGVYSGHNLSKTSSSNIEIPKNSQFYNVVVILAESLGDNYVESQGGIPVAPNLDKLRLEGWWFENMYATGHRSTRGIEAVTASMPPSSLQGLSLLQPPVAPYATTFNVFQHAGYKTSFVYAGYSDFTNMGDYFLQNGMDYMIERKDYDNPRFDGPWGASDEDLFERADQVYSEHHAKGEKFFSVIFTTSFHDPFEVPQGRVDLGDIETDEPKRLLAAKYSDYALGKFMDKAKQSEYYKDTIFLIITDHENQVKGAGKFPLDDFTIPALIIGPNVKPYIDKRQVSQIDMGVTIMSLAGLRAEVPNVGQNLLYDDVQPRALMQFNNIFGLLEGDKFIQIAPHNQPYMFNVVNGDQLEDLDTVDDEMLQRAVDLSNLGPIIYRNEYMSINCVKVYTHVNSEHNVIAEAEPNTESEIHQVSSVSANEEASEKAVDDEREKLQTKVALVEAN